MSRRHQLQDATGVLLSNGNGDVLAGSGPTVPSDAATGYASGCTFYHTDGSGATDVLYVNIGSASSANFDPVTSLTGGDLTFTGNINLTGNLVLTGNLDVSAAAADVVAKANTAAALEVTNGTTAMIAVDTRNTIADVNAITFQAAATTIATAAAAHVNPVVKVANRTITYTGTNSVTSQLGAMLNVGVLTLTDASAGTAARMISTSVTDCYLTNAGVWTDTACWARGKEKIKAAGAAAIESMLERLTPRTWQYKADGEHGDDRGRQRVGIVYDELPDELRAPGQDAVSPGVLASFALAALKYLKDENEALKARLTRLEAAN
jgi:hypothetical protein